MGAGCSRHRHFWAARSAAQPGPREVSIWKRRHNKLDLSDMTRWAGRQLATSCFGSPHWPLFPTTQTPKSSSLGYQHPRKAWGPRTGPQQRVISGAVEGRAWAGTCCQGAHVMAVITECPLHRGQSWGGGVSARGGPALRNEQQSRSKKRQEGPIQKLSEGTRAQWSERLGRAARLLTLTL